MKTLFFGDTSPSKNSKESFRRKEVDKLFTDVKDFMKDSDFTFVNLECALTECTEQIKKFGPALAAPKETAEILKELGVDLCGLSNNHTFDLGIQGIKDTIAALDEQGLDYTGWGDNYEDSRKNYVLERDGEKICIITVCEHEYSYALENRMGARPYDEYDTMEDIREARKSADRVIVIYHGGKEYCRYPSPRLLKLCRAMARCGADMVICQHSHCIGCYEEYEGGHILYGQGNFHFVTPSKRECWLSGLAVKYDTVSHKIEFVPLNMLEKGIETAKGERAKKIMGEFEKRNLQLQNGQWKKGWEEFCASVSEGYKKCMEKAFAKEASESDKQMFPHYFDCEAHSDVLREIYKTYNHTNCK